VSVLTIAFERLDVRDRMNCIALVCTSWAAAAEAANSSIELSRCANTDSLQQWLHSRGSQVIKVQLRGAKGVLTSLPCPRLEWLVLDNISVDLRPGSQLLQDLSAATALEHLQLDDVVLQGEADLVAQQQRPSVSHSLLWSEPGASHHWCYCFADERMQVLCKLTQLHSLELHSMADVTAAGLAGLQRLPGLKRLGLEDLRCVISASAVPAFTQLTALTCLKLGWMDSPPPGDFHPSVLAHLTQLEELHLRNPEPAGGASGAAELLARLAQLPKLQVLHLACTWHLVTCPPAAFSSLTSSSILRSLTWSDVG